MLFFVPSFTRRITKSGTAYLTGIRLTTYMNKFNVFFNYMKTKTIETIKNMLTLQFYVLKIRHFLWHLKMMFIFIYGDFLGLKLCQGGPSWSSSYDSWIYNYQCNQCLSPLMVWVRLPFRTRSTTLCDKVCQWLVADQWFSLGPPVSSANKYDCHDITEILLQVALDTV
jgi:hypothetical protein